MNVTSELVQLTPTLRCRVFTPVGTQRWPAVVAYSDIFQHTGPHERICTRLAGHGFVVIASELYGHVEPAIPALRFEEDRQRALDAAAKLKLEWIDEDIATALAFAKVHPRVEAERLLCCGWCIGGHLAFRAARSPEVKATVCFYATGLSTDSVGAAQGTAKSLADAGKIQGELLMVWGTRDPHIPKDARQRIHAALAQSGVSFQVRTFDAEHTFMRDEGARWEPAAADEAFGAMLSLFEG